MDDIEIVIKISEKEYNAIKENVSGIFGGHIYQAIRNGRPLSEYYPVIHHKKPITKENIDDYIKRSDIGLTDFEIVMCNGNYKEALKMLLNKIEKAPSAIPEPKTGYWIRKEQDDGGIYCECSNCGHRSLLIYDYIGFEDDYETWSMFDFKNYCSSCGAKMEGVNYGKNGNDCK